MPKATKPRQPNNYEPGSQTGDEIITAIDDILGMVSDYTRSGRPVPNPMRSVANMPEIPLVEFQSRGMPLVGPGYQSYAEPLATTRVKELYAARQPAQIAALLDGLSLDLPNYGPLPEDYGPPRPRPTAPKVPKSAILGPLATFIDLLLTTTDTNKNESEDLRKKRGPDYSNKDTYNAELINALQQLTRGVP